MSPALPGHMVCGDFSVCDGQKGGSDGEAPPEVMSSLCMCVHVCACGCVCGCVCSLR